VIQPLLVLPRHVSQRLVEALAGGALEVPYPEPALVACLGEAGAAPEIAAALRSLDQAGVDAAAIAAILEATAEVARDSTTPDLVWTGPELSGLHARDTRRVYEELLGGAARSLWVSTYAIFDGPRAFRILAERMDQRPQLEVVLLLNVQRKPGDTTKASDLVRAFAEKFWAKEWPGERRPQVFYDPRSLAPDGPEGVLHAKAVVADDEAVFVTSANLTEAAFDRNIEVGMLARDRGLAENLKRHFRILIEKRLLHTMPEFP
jgi:phosphatidylserine/phosphatidylglycerophosphate/cardiolipin synthase-like enzyme